MLWDIIFVLVTFFMRFAPLKNGWENRYLLEIGDLVEVWIPPSALFASSTTWGIVTGFGITGSDRSVRVSIRKKRNPWSVVVISEIDCEPDQVMNVVRPLFPAPPN